MTTRPRTTTGPRTDAEILTHLARMLAFREMLDDLHTTPAAETADTVDGSGSLARDQAPDGEGSSWRRKSSSN